MQRGIAVPVFGTICIGLKTWVMRSQPVRIVGPTFVMTAWTLLAVATIAVGQDTQKSYSSASLFSKYKSDVVEVELAGKARGTGFIVSPDGLVLTANHVASPDGSVGPGPYLTDLKVKFPDGSENSAMPTQPSSSQESFDHDYAILRTGRKVSIHFTLGTWGRTAEGESLTSIGYPFFATFPVLLVGTLSGRGPCSASVNCILFQAPNNRGFSGSPLISDRTGEVIGMVTTKIAGITTELSSMRKSLNEAGGAGVSVGGVSMTKATIDLIDVLDQYLISGMGTAVAIDYAKSAVLALGH